MKLEMRTATSARVINQSPTEPFGRAPGWAPIQRGLGASLAAACLWLTGPAHADSVANTFAQLLGLSIAVADLTPLDDQAPGVSPAATATAQTFVQMAGLPEALACCGLNLSSTRNDPGKLFARSEVKVTGLSGSAFFLATEINGTSGEAVAGNEFRWSLLLSPGTQLQVSTNATVGAGHVGIPSDTQRAWAAASVTILDATGLPMGVSDEAFVERRVGGSESLFPTLSAWANNESGSPLSVTLLVTTQAFVTSVPEPATVLLLCAGLVVLAARSGRRSPRA